MTSEPMRDPAAGRVTQAGAKLVGAVGLLCEPQRDWPCTETADAFAESLFDVQGR